MNSAILFRLAESGLLILVVLVSMSAALGPRRWLARKARDAKGVLVKGVFLVLRSVVFPLLALVLGGAVLWMPVLLDVPWAGMIPDSHRAAWNLFWLVVLGFNVVEAIGMHLAVSRGRAPLPALLRGVLRVAVTAMAAFFVLRFELGLNITPLLASTALVTAVVGFALQGVLGNLLAGMSLNMTGTLAHRDWVFIDDVEGQVDEMNWRETWVVTRENIPVRIPNSKVADARIRHLSRPATPRRCSVFVDASYGDPPDAVIDAMLAAAAAVPEVRRTPAPLAMVLEFKSYGVGYELRFWLDQYALREPVQGEIRRQIWYQFRRAGIQIPYPVSDQVLNDFMERAIVPAPPPDGDPEARRRAAGLLNSDFARQVLQGADGQPLVPEAELAEWAGRLQSEGYGRGEILYRQGDAGDSCHVVLSGRLTGTIRHREAGKETTFEVGPGAVIGEMSLLTGLPRMAEVKVAESAELLRVPADEFAELLEGHPGLLEQFSELAAVRARDNRRQFEDLMAADAPPVDQAISNEGILKRFWHLIGHGKR